MELRQLEAFVAVAEERNFTRAAARLHVAQSGLSATIRTLERELHSPLFLRTTRHVGLSAAGAALLSEARRTLASARAATEAVAAVEGLQRGSVALGVMQSSSFIDLAGLLLGYRAAYPGIDIKLRQASAAELGAMLRDHALDLIFTIGGDGTEPEILSKPLVRSPVIVACHPDDPLANRKTIELRMLADRALVGFPPGWGVRDLTDAAMRDEGLQPNYAFEINDTTTVLDLVQSGCGVGVLPSVMAAARPGLRCIPIKGRLRPWTIAAQVLAPGPPSRAARAVWEMLDGFTAAGR